MAKYYAGIDTSIGVGNETLDGMLTNGSTYGISPSQTIDCSSVIADNNFGIGSTDPQFKLDVLGNTRINRLSAGGALVLQTSVDDATDRILNFN